jgi:hypothetical protein
MARMALQFGHSNLWPEVAKKLVKAGTLVYAKREFLNHNKYSAAEGGDSESALLRSGSGVARRRRHQDLSRLSGQ